MSLKRFFIGSDKDTQLEQQLLNILILVFFIFSSLGAILSFAIAINNQITLVTTLFPIILAGVYILNRVFNLQKLSKWLMALISWITINLAWYFNYGAEGPAIFYFIICMIILTMLFEGSTLIVLFGFLMVNVISLLYIELYTGIDLGTYIDKTQMVNDSYLSLFVLILFAGGFFYVIKKNYNEQFQKAKLADELKTIFLQNILHEIRTPLNAIVGFSDLITLDDNSEHKKEQYSKIISSNSYFLARLIDDIMDISKIEANQLEIIKEMVNVHDLFEQLREIFSRELVLKQKENINLYIFPPDKKLVVFTDKHRLEQILRNFLVNAIKYTESGQITLSVMTYRDEITFYVKDTGIGISKKDQNWLFKRHSTLSSSKKQKYGSGIGLSLCKQLAGLLGGKIRVESELGKGSTFYLEFPAFIQLER